MKINKAFSSLLYELYGPNGSDVFVHTNQKIRYKALKELERHGLVELTLQPNLSALDGQNNVWKAVRTCRDLKG